MDAAHTTTLKRTALFLTIALLLAAPFAAQAQPAFFFPNGATASMSGTAYGCTQVNSSNSTAITYNATQVPATGGVVDPTLEINPSNTGLTTGNQVCFRAATIPGNVTAGSHNITVTLHATSPQGVNDSTITVTWSPSGTGTGTGGSSGSGATANVSQLAMTSYQGSLGSATFSLTDTAAGQVNYNISINYASGSSGNWLSVSPQLSGYLQTTNYSQQFTVSGNPSGLSNGTYNATLAITLTGVGTGTINIPVQFSVTNNTGSSSGNIIASPNPINLNYVTGSNQAPTQFVTLSTAASTFNASVTSGQSWLLVNGQSQAFGLAVSGGLSVTTILGNLPTSNATGSIQVVDSLNNQVSITVNFSVNGATNGLSISPSPLTLNAAVGQTQQVAGTLTVSSSNTSGTLAITGTTGTGISAVLNNSSIVAGGSQTITVYGNPAGLAANTYQGSVTVTLNNSVSATVNVNFVVGSGSTGTAGSVAPTSLQFAYEQNFPQSGSSSSLVPQYITNSVNGAYTAVVNSGSWLSVTPSGSGPGLLTVTANPAGLASSSTPYSGSFTVTTPAGTTTVNVTLLVSSGVVVFANPGVLNMSYTAGSSNPVTTFQVLSSDGTAVPISATSSQSWLTVQQLSSTTTSGFALTVNGSVLPNGVNIANVTVSSNASNTTLVVPVVVTVSGSSSTGGSLTLGSSSLTFTGQVNGSAPSTQTLSVTSSIATNYTASAYVSSGGTNWLSISPSGSLNTSSTSTLTVSANQAGLQAGTYSGTISLVTSNGTQTVPVTLVVTTTSTGAGNVTLSPTALTFNYQSGGTVPGGQGFNVTSVSGTSISYTVGVTTASGGNWLATNITSGVTGQPVNVILNSSVVSTLAPGTYTGTVTVSPSGGTAATVAVTLIVQGLPTVSASPATISLSYQAGSTNTPTATVQVSGSAANLSFTANASSSGWLSVSPTSGSTGNSGVALSVTTSPSSLAAGTYTGTIIVSGTSGAQGSSTITVTLTVTAPLPTIQAVVSAASGASGPVAPGEIVSIFAPSTNPIGPSTPASLTLDSNGNVATTLAGVQVLFNGIPAPLTYVSSTQINCVVPYGIAGLFAPYAQVKYLNQSSNAFTLTTTSSAPGIFSQNGSGTGPGAILNQDNSVNGASRPATKGSVIVIYMTGEGATSPTGITGKVNCPSGTACSISQLPVPLLPVTVTFIDSTGARYPANYIFAGEAPGFVSGVLQVDAVVPTTVPSGTLQVVVGVGANTSQAGITVAVQ